MLKTAGKLIAVAVVGMAAMFALASCVNLSDEQKQRLEELRIVVVEYMEQKYGEEYTISKSGYEISTDGLFPYATENVWFTFEDGTTAYYYAYTDSFYDDGQAEEINAAILEDVWEPMIDDLDRTSVTDLYFTSVEYTKDDSSSFYHEYYDGGSIKSYLKKEDARVEAKIYCLIHDADDDWESLFDIAEDTIYGYFSGWADVTVYACKQSYVSSEHQYYGGIQYDDCFAIMYLSQKGDTKLYVQHYIEIADGIYATVKYDDGFELKDGDIVLEVTETAEDAVYYKAVFSDRLKEQMGDDSYVSCYIKLDEDVYGKYDEDGEGDKLKTFNRVNDSGKDVVLVERDPGSVYIMLKESDTYYYGIVQTDSDSSEG